MQHAKRNDTVQFEWRRRCWCCCCCQSCCQRLLSQPLQRRMSQPLRLLAVLHPHHLTYYTMIAISTSNYKSSPVLAKNVRIACGMPINRNDTCTVNLKIIGKHGMERYCRHDSQHVANGHHVQLLSVAWKLCVRPASQACPTHQESTRRLV